jgi:hypothetical protein
MTKCPLEWGWDQPDNSESSTFTSTAWKPKSTRLGSQGDEMDVAAVGDLKCQGGDCNQGGTWGTTGAYYYGGKILGRDCTVKARGIEDLPGSEQDKLLERHELK